MAEIIQLAAFADFDGERQSDGTRSQTVPGDRSADVIIFPGVRIDYTQVSDTLTPSDPSSSTKRARRRRDA